MGAITREDIIRTQSQRLNEAVMKPIEVIEDLTCIIYCSEVPGHHCFLDRVQYRYICAAAFLSHKGGQGTGGAPQSPKRLFTDSIHAGAGP